MPAKIDSITLKFLEYFKIDAEAGVIRHEKCRRGYGAKRGSIAGCLRKDGYVDIQKNIDGKHYSRLAHILIWVSVNGPPKGDIAHKNGIKDDNRISNLEDISHIQNCRGPWESSRRRTDPNANVPTPDPEQL